MTNQFIIGIDGGGTKTCGRIENLITKEQFEVKGGPSSLTNDFNLAVGTISGLIQQMLQAMQADKSATSLVIGVAGGGVVSQAEKLTHILNQGFASILVCNDATTSLYGANNGEPVTVVALGTGSVGARLDPDHTEHYYGGWGFPIGDEGGGAKLGFHAIQHLLTELDKFEQPTTAISKNLYQRFNNNRLDLANWLRDATPIEYADICPTIFAFEYSCEAARALILQHAQHCEELINTTRKDSNSPVVLLGGLAQTTLPYLSQEIAQYCQLSMGTALDGACLLAKQHIHDPITLPNNGLERASGPANIKNDFEILQQLNQMVSEERNPNTMQIDLMDVTQILTHINNEDQKVAEAVAQCISPISEAVEHIVRAFEQDARLIYIGAGTSGRLGILDAVECPPTFSVTPQQVVGIIAGGDKAVYKSVEGAEDNTEAGKADLQHIDFGPNDILVGIAASGRTPYVIGALDYANEIGAKTVALTCNPNSELDKHADITICPVVGPEVLSGSTRMKSGTAQKLVLNMLTTTSMILCGKSYENLMVDVSASNKKLYMRAIRIVMQATGCDSLTAEKALTKTNFVVKLAILHILTNASPEICQQTLAQNKGFLRKSVTQLS